MTDPWKVDATIANMERDFASHGFGPSRIFWAPCSPERAYLVWDQALSGDKRMRLLYAQQANPERPLAEMPLVIRMRMFRHLPAFRAEVYAEMVNARSQGTG